MYAIGGKDAALLVEIEGISVLFIFYRLQQQWQLYAFSRMKIAVQVDALPIVACPLCGAIRICLLYTSDAADE